MIHRGYAEGTLVEYEWDEDTNSYVRMLKSSLESLALPGKEALDTLSPRYDRPFELADDACNGARLLLSKANGSNHCSFMLSSIEAQSLQGLVDHIDSMSGPRNARLWNEQAVIESKEWATARRLAVEALDTIEWPPWL